MSPVGAMWAAPAALRLLRVALTRGSRAIRNKINTVSKSESAHRQFTNNAHQSIYSSAVVRQPRRVPRTKVFNTTPKQSFIKSLRRYITTESGVPRFDRTKFPKSETATRVAQQSGRAPFASTLRPNLTGGAFPRSAGGYSFGGGSGVRYFSHTPSAPAQVVNNVSQAMRAFCLSGQRAQFDGVDIHGNATFRAVSVEEDNKVKAAIKAPTNVPGSFIDFHLSPTVTALTPLAGALQTSAAVNKNQGSAAPTLNTEGILSDLSIDFARGLKDLSLVLADIKKLSELGDLPIALESPGLIRVRFPGVDARTVESICDDLEIRRGIVGEDPGFGWTPDGEMAFKFPFAPGLECEDHEILRSPDESLLSADSIEEMFAFEEANPWLSEIDEEGYETMSPRRYVESLPGSGFYSEASDDLGDIYTFLEECEREQTRNRFN
ncbi:hypothetical protein TD95_002585 [Thielaviopsis punctulata]|uniref:Casein kinase II beta 2 subunit n=1 Tax=Thielaviopsis punctulata TaxID=72032 RepID=A0A0F4ZEB1_9PEZI|nr:hypothetical protein TD95_002585 [Thielaviopsis punctulata]